MHDCTNAWTSWIVSLIIHFNKIITTLLSKPMTRQSDYVKSLGAYWKGECSVIWKLNYTKRFRKKNIRNLSATISCNYNPSYGSKPHSLVNCYMDVTFHRLLYRLDHRRPLWLILLYKISNSQFRCQLNPLVRHFVYLGVIWKVTFATLVTCLQKTNDRKLFL